MSNLHVGNVEAAGSISQESTANFNEEIVQTSSKPAAASTKLSKMPMLFDKCVYLNIKVVVRIWSDQVMMGLVSL